MPLDLWLDCQIDEAYRSWNVEVHSGGCSPWARGAPRPGFVANQTAILFVILRRKCERVSNVPNSRLHDFIRETVIGRGVLSEECEGRAE